MSDYFISLDAAFVSLLTGVILFRLQDKLAYAAKPRDDASAIQASHVGDPLRLGGVAVLLGLTFAIGVRASSGEGTFAPLLLLTALPVLIAGLAEDLGHHVSPQGRFLAAVFSAIAAVALLGAWIPKAHIPGVDLALSVPMVAIVVTVVFSATFSHAVNLIDGMNGLSATVVITSALGCFGVALQASQPEIATFALILASATAGFLFLNWPVARLFLGDAGAYGLGHLLAWLTIMLAWNSPDVTVPALILIIFWPLADVIHTVARRMVVRVSILEPDRLHIHQVIRRILDIIWFGYRGRARSNPLTTLILLPFIVAPVVTGVLLWDMPLAAWIAVGAFMLAFFATHPLTSSLARWRRK